MTFRSLRLRLLVGGAIVILVTLCVDWLAMSVLIEWHLERFEIVGLDYESLQLIAGYHLDSRGAPVVVTPPPDTRFLIPAGGRYWQISTAAGTVRSPSLKGRNLPLPIGSRDHDWHARTLEGPFGQSIILVERHPKAPGGVDVVVQFGDQKAAVRVARSEFGKQLILFLVGLWVVLSAAAAIQVHLGLQPLTRLRDALMALRVNPMERLAVGDHPPEVEPLTRAINELAEAREQDLMRARRRAADLAHGLKTPLSVLAAQSRHVRDIGGAEIADGLDRAIAAAGAAVEAELARARAAAARQSVEPEVVPARLVAERVISVVENTEAGAKLVFEVEVSDDLRLPGSADELSEIVGALTENAARFARRRVRIAAGLEDGVATLTIEDDGPGLEGGRAHEALMRGRRLDETGWGHGLGLSIARDLAEARGGSIRLGRSQMGGLLVEITWSQNKQAEHHGHRPEPAMVS